MTMKANLSYYVVPGLPTVKATDKKSIVDFVATELDINPQKLKRPDRNRIYVQARNMCYFILLHQVGMTSVAIGHYFNRDHSTVLHGLRMHKNDYEQNETYKEKFDEIVFLMKLYKSKPKLKKSLYAI